MLGILYSESCIHYRHSSGCRAASTDDNRAETRHGTDVKEDANIGSKNGSERIKEPELAWGLIFFWFSSIKRRVISVRNWNQSLRDFWNVGNGLGGQVKTRKI